MPAQMQSPKDLFLFDLALRLVRRLLAWTRST